MSTPRPPAAQVMDLGYRGYEGPRGGRGGAVRALWLHGVRRGLGLGRRARAKLLPFGFLTLGLITALALLVLRYGASLLPVGDLGVDLPGAGGVLAFMSAPSQVLVAIVAVELVLPDRATGLLRLIASRPLTPWDYAAARMGALVTVLSLVLLAPLVLLALGSILLSSSPGSEAAAQLSLLWQAPVVLLAAAGSWGGTAVLIAAVARRRSVAIGAVLATLFVVSPSLAAFTEAGPDGFEWVGIVAVHSHPSIVRDWVLGADQSALAGMAGLPPAAALVTAIALGAGAVALLAIRVRQAS